MPTTQYVVNVHHTTRLTAIQIFKVEKIRISLFLERCYAPVREGLNEKKNVFGPLFRSAFLVNKKSIFLQKCQCIELLTVF